jgi:hypothetical protein
MRYTDTDPLRPAASWKEREFPKLILDWGVC